MGTFMGHVVPGAFFVLFGTWWTVQIYRRFHICKRKGDQFKSSVTFSWRPDSTTGHNVEGACKVIGAILGIIGETYTGLRTPGGFPLANMQHITMYVFFGMSGAVDVIIRRKPCLPELHLDYVILILAVAIELILFKFHLHGRNQLDVQVHQLLILAIFCNLICLVLEAVYRHHVLAALGRSYFSILQGTWFIQVGFILYNPLPKAIPWKEDDPIELGSTVSYFTWHCMGTVLIVILLGICLGRHNKDISDNSIRYQRVANDSHDLD